MVGAGRARRFGGGRMRVSRLLGRPWCGIRVRGLAAYRLRVLRLGLCML